VIACAYLPRTPTTGAGAAQDVLRDDAYQVVGLAPAENADGTRAPAGT
jgi:hypothetical protein